MVFRTWHLGYSFIMVVSLLCGVAWGQQTAPKGSTQSLQSLQSLPVSVPGPMQLNWYIAAGYSIYGPARVASNNSKVLGFPEAYGIPGPTISLANKSVAVMNQTGASVPLSALTPGTNVIVCDRRDSVVVFIVTTLGVSNVKR